tara:strand:- start:755 stop:1072 length:318 start_codon:yes stop_codon:yes gene_type:complete
MDPAMTRSEVLRGPRVGAILILVALAMLTGCRAEEQGRPLLYEKGTYLGKQEPALAAEVRAQLDRRASLQAGGAGLQFGGAPTGGVPVGGPPKMLGDRVLKQGGQ